MVFFFLNDVVKYIYFQYIYLITQSVMTLMADSALRSCSTNLAAQSRVVNY